VCVCVNVQVSSDGLYVRRSPSVPTINDVAQWKDDIKKSSVVIVSSVFTVSALEELQPRARCCVIVLAQ